MIEAYLYTLIAMLGAVVGVLGLYGFIRYRIVPALSMPGARRKSPQSSPSGAKGEVK